MNQPEQEQFKLWAKQIKHSNRNAFDDLFRFFYPRLLNFATSYTKEKSSAGDIVQDAFVILWQKRKMIDPDQSLKAYLYKIVRNRTLNYLRNHASESLRPEVTMMDSEKNITVLQTGTGDQTEDLAEKFREWIEQLPDRQQEAFELSRFDGLNHKEIAAVMDVSPKTVNNHIVAALSRLRTFYEEYQENKHRT